jgi:hypothetical protein
VNALNPWNIDEKKCKIITSNLALKERGREMVPTLIIIWEKVELLSTSEKY